MPLDVSGFIPDTTPNKGLDLMAQKLDLLAQRKYEINYRKQKNAEADQWKKLELVNDLTDLSNHQTGDDVADALGRKKASEIYQKYTQAASKLSPAELQANIQKDMFGTINALDAAKSELSKADKQLILLKTKFPSLDIETLSKDYRKEILSRRLDKDGNFANPISVPLSSFDVTDPEHLSKYSTGNKELSNAITNPQGVETMKVFSGTPRAYTEYTGKVPFWKKENFDRATLKNGFINIKGEPKLELKAHAVPALGNDKNGMPIMAMDEDVYARFNEDEQLKLQLTAATREKFGSKYDTFNAEEKNLAKRATLYEKMESLDKSNYYPSRVKAEPINKSSTTINNTKKELTVDDVYGGIDEKTNDPKRPHKAVPITELSEDEGSVVLKIARDRLGSDAGITQAEIYVKKDDDGVIRIYNVDGSIVAPLTKKGTNKLTQVGVDERRTVVENANKDKAQDKEATYEIKGKKWTEKELIKMGYTKEQIAPYKK